MINIDVFAHIIYYVELPEQLPTSRQKGSPNKAQMNPKSLKTPPGSHIKNTSKIDDQNEPKLVPKWGPKVEPKSPKMTSWGHLRTRVAPERPPDPLQDQFWRCFGTICGPVLTDFPKHLKSFLDA